MSTRERQTIEERNEVVQLDSERRTHTIWRCPMTGGCEYGNPS